MTVVGRNEQDSDLILKCLNLYYYIIESILIFPYISRFGPALTRTSLLADFVGNPLLLWEFHGISHRSCHACFPSITSLTVSATKLRNGIVTSSACLRASRPFLNLHLSKPSICGAWTKSDQNTSCWSYHIIFIKHDKTMIKPYKTLFA